MATRRGAIAFRHLSRRLLGSSSSAAAASPRLLGYFHPPGATVCLNVRDQDSSSVCNNRQEEKTETGRPNRARKPSRKFFGPEWVN
ncbi:unnamed protein product [Urochloa humidicola]